MQLTNITCLLLLLLGSHRTLADDEISKETNEIIPREAIQKLDFSVRQALLRAIDKLEQEADEDDADGEGDEENDDDDVANTTTLLPTRIKIQSTTALPLTTQTKDEILEESTNAADILPSVQFFTATYDENNAHEQTLAAFIDKTKALKKSNKNNLGSPVLVTTNVDVESGDNHQAARSVGTSIQTNEISSTGLDEIKFEIRNVKTSPKPETTTTTTTTTARPRTTRRRTTTTSTTTTTTTPRPTHNEDGENIEVVDKDDIRIQAAPLVSAFTVDLDELGSAKKVVPIIDTAPPTVPTRGSSTQRNGGFQPALHFGPTITKLNVLQSDTPKSANNFLSTPLPTQPTFGSSTTSSNVFANIVPTSGHYITKQPLSSNLNHQTSNNVNNYFFEKQRELEQQIYQLKLQAQQQQELILRQLKLLEEQSRQRNTQTSSQSQTQLNRQQHVPTSQHETSFTIRPSVEFIPSTQTKISPLFPTFPNEQQLPLKESNGKFINGANNKNNQFSTNNIITPPSQQQQLPDVNNPIQQIFHNLQQKLQNQQPANAQSVSSISSIQIQPSNQLNIGPTFAPSLPQQPAELSLVQALPQRNYQQFQQAPLIPQYVTNAILERQQQQNPQQHRARLFRQEVDTGNFGLNQVQINPSNIFSSFNQQQQPQQQQQHHQNFDSQTFYRQHLNPDISNQLQQNAKQYYQQQQQQQSSSQTALNHGINHFAQQ